MHWNGDFAALLFVNNWEYTRNETFARETVYPLVSGLVSWWSCFLQRSSKFTSILTHPLLLVIYGPIWDRLL